MAYVQITTRCNMTCPHCCFNCTRKGEDMDLNVFERVLDIISERGDLITIGGGEPTVHKDFFKFLNIAIDWYNTDLIQEPPLVITNGKLKGKTHKLLDMIEDECHEDFYIELSQDEWHDPIDETVVSRWKRVAKYHEKVDIRTVRKLTPVGRAGEPERGLDYLWNDEKCACDDLFFAPDGSVYSCGCKHTKLGDVWNLSSRVLQEYDISYAHEGGFEETCLL